GRVHVARHQDAEQGAVPHPRRVGDALGVATLSRRERVVIGAGAVMALVVGAYLFVVEPLLTRARDAEAAVLAREAALQRRRLLIGQRARLTEELAAVEGQVDAESRRLLRGPPAPPAPPRPPHP